MNKPLYLLTMAFAAMMLFPVSVSAQNPSGSKITLDDLTFGETLTGETINKKQLKGHVVVVEYWGVR